MTQASPATLLCVPIMVEDIGAALSDAAEAKRAGADLVEFRVDRVFHGEGDAEGLSAVVRLAGESPLPCIVTCRAAREGGEYDGDDAGRVALWEHLGLARLPPRYIDVEAATYARSANLRQKVGLAVRRGPRGGDYSSSLILSSHDFSGRPADLARRLAEMRGHEAARVLKIAWRARSLRDNIEAFEVLQQRDRPTIALCMGEFGLLSRVLAPKFGGFLTFASLREASATAPGQPTVRELVEVYRFRAIGPATRVYGVIGWPVGHSRSPRLHNAGFEAVGFDGVHVPMPVPAEWEHFKATVLSLMDCSALEFRGASVTLPHKEHLVRLAREDHSRRWSIDAMAARCGAGNTLVVGDDGSCAVMNTDASAAVDAVRGSVKGGIAGARVAVLGAGGMARAAVAGFAEAGAEVIVVSRRGERSAALAAELGGGVSAGRWGEVGALGADVVVNATPVGMAGGPEPGAMPLTEAELRGLAQSAVVFDTVYTPAQTPLLRAARSAGLAVVDGVSMFVGQAAGQFRGWTGVAGPPAVFCREFLETPFTNDS